MSVKPQKGYVGSPDWQTSTANQEVVSDKDPNWTEGYSFYRFEFYNLADCHVSINGGDFIFIAAYQNFLSDAQGRPISSFIIQEAGVKFHWIGFYK